MADFTSPQAIARKLRDVEVENTKLRSVLKPFAGIADQADQMEKVSASVGHDALEAAGLRALVNLCRAARDALARF